MQELFLWLFYYKNASQSSFTIFAREFFTDDWKHKTISKGTCRTPSANPNQLMCTLAE